MTLTYSACSRTAHVVHHVTCSMKTVLRKHDKTHLLLNEHVCCPVHSHCRTFVTVSMPLETDVEISCRHSTAQARSLLAWKLRGSSSHSCCNSGYRGFLFTFAT